MGEVLFPHVVQKVTPPVALDSIFANNTWTDIISACQKNRVPDTWAVGDQKAMTINGKEYLVDIIGKHHDDYADGSGKAPLTFQMHDLYATTYKMHDASSNMSGWVDSYMRARHLPVIFALMPAEVQTAIKGVSKRSSAGNQDATIDITTDTLFLLSEIEIFGTANNSKGEEGRQYDYYKAGNSTVKKNNSGSAAYWWERSPVGNSTIKFCIVGPSGEATSYPPNSAQGVSFAFCF